MDPKTENLVGTIVGITATALLLTAGIVGIGMIIDHSIEAHEKEVNEAVAAGRLIKADGYVIEKLTILDHEYLKLGDAMTHSASCPCHKEPSHAE